MHLSDAAVRNLAVPSHMKRTTVSLSVLLAAALGYAGYLQTELNRLKPEADRVPSTDIAEMEGEISAAVEEDVVMTSEVESKPPVVEGTEPPAASREDVRENRRLERMRQMAAAFDDPQMRMDMVERQMNRVDSRFADFFKDLDLNPDDVDTLRTLMAERGVIDWEMRMRSFGADSEEARVELERERERQKSLLEEQIAGLIGENNTLALQDYTETLPYRNEVEALASSLSFTDSPLSPEQSEVLVRSIRDVSEEFEYSVDLSNMRRRGISEVSSEDIETYFDERSNLEEQVLAAASDSLSDAQLAAYAERQLAERERDRRQLEFIQQNPGAGGGPRGDRRGFQRP